QLLRPVRNGKELADVARRFENCLDDCEHLIRLGLGTRWFFEWRGDAPAVVVVGVGCRDLHWIDQACGPENETLEHDVSKALPTELRSMGIDLVEANLEEALSETTDLSVLLDEDDKEHTFLNEVIRDLEENYG